MKVSTWAEIRRLHEIEKLSKRAIAKQVRCSRRTIDKALALQEAPSTKRETLPKKSILDRYKPKIDAIIKQYPDLSAVRILEKIAVNDGVTAGYTGSISQLKCYLRTIRPIQGRVYQDITYSPGEAIQIDWGDVGSVKINNTIRKVSVFVAVPRKSSSIISKLPLLAARVGTPHSTLSSSPCVVITAWNRLHVP